jgi:glutathione synthase/RimK-type ligase-like ATP-grasp enzyme
MLVIRSVWDYHYRYEEFLDWLSLLERKNVRVFNSVSALRENCNKIYLLKLQEMGVPLVPSVFCRSGETFSQDLSALFEAFKCEELIVKPLVGASSYHIEKIDKTTQMDFIVYSQDNPCGFIVQKFIPEVLQEGEVSLVYFNGVFSHAVRKKPVQGDFRVQDDYGGTFEYFEPHLDLRQRADDIARCLPSDLLYARIDCLWSTSMFYLMEIELVEPILYLHDAQCRRRFIDALISRCVGGTEH